MNWRSGGIAPCIFNLEKGTNLPCFLLARMGLYPLLYPLAFIYVHFSPHPEDGSSMDL
jgi:hypothetical protein